MQMNQASDLEPALPPYEGISLADVLLIHTQQHADEALAALMSADVIGFDTESKPTFIKGEISDGPHLIQLSTDGKVYLFPVSRMLHIGILKTILESQQTLKVGFGLRDDIKRLKIKLGISTANVLDLAVALRENKRCDLGAKSAVARFFGMRLQKSKKTSTTNWSTPHLTDRQILYAADDAQVALRVYRKWRCEAHPVEAGSD